MPLRTGRPDEQGFTLLEVLIALTILGMSLAVLMTSISQGLENADRSRKEAGAGAVAGSVLAELGRVQPIAPGTLTGTAGDGYSWSLTIAPYATGNANTGTPNGTDERPFSGGLVTLDVSWQDGTRRRDLTLTTLRIMPKGGPS